MGPAELELAGLMIFGLAIGAGCGKAIADSTCAGGLCPLFGLFIEKESWLWYEKFWCLVRIDPCACMRSVCGVTTRDEFMHCSSVGWRK